MSKRTYKQFTEEQGEINEIMSFADRKKAARRMIQMAKKSSHKFLMKIKKQKIMPMADGIRLGAKKVLAFIKQKIVGKNKDMKELGISQKMRLEKQAKQKQKMMGPAKLKMMAKKFAKGIIKKHREAAIKMKQKKGEDAIDKVHSAAKKAGVDPKTIEKSKDHHSDKLAKHADKHIEKGSESETDAETGKGKEPEQDLSKKDDEKSDDKKSGFKGFFKKHFGKKDK